MYRRSFLQQMLLTLKGAPAEKIRKAVDEHSHGVRSWTLAVAQRGERVAWSGGTGAGATRGERVYLLASITKPMTATAVMVLADRGQLRLADPARRFLPEFTGGGRDAITIRHLLTHTSGLPDMLPENEELRKRHAPLADFVAGAVRTPLLFAPGTQMKYQSMGILLAAEIVQRVAKQPLPAFLREHVFTPLGMRQTALGLGHHKIPQTEQCQVTGNDDWNWNSPYWRNLGAPWGGAHATASDVMRLLEYFAAPDARVLKPETARAMVTNQNSGLNEPWGIGWAVNGPKFARRCSAATFGHSGSTGTLCWLDPASQAAFVLLTTRPAAESSETFLKPVSETVAAEVAA